MRRVFREHAIAIRGEPLEIVADPQRAFAIFEQHSGIRIRQLEELRIAGARRDNRETVSI